MPIKEKPVSLAQELYKDYCRKHIPIRRRIDWEDLEPTIRGKFQIQASKILQSEDSDNQRTYRDKMSRYPTDREDGSDTHNERVINKPHKFKV